MWKKVASQGAVSAQSVPTMAAVTAVATATMRSDADVKGPGELSEREQHLLRSEQRQERDERVGEVEADHAS